MAIKNHWLVILAFALPILLVIGIALSAYWPAWSLSTEYDFVYATCGSNYQSSYPYNYDCVNYLSNYYQIKNLKLNELLTAPDGVSVARGYQRGEIESFPFFNGDGSRYGYYLVKGNKKQKLNLVGEDGRVYYYRDNFKFIGWIIK